MSPRPAVSSSTRHDRRQPADGEGPPERWGWRDLSKTSVGQPGMPVNVMHRRFGQQRHGHRIPEEGLAAGVAEGRTPRMTNWLGSTRTTCRAGTSPRPMGPSYGFDPDPRPGASRPRGAAQTSIGSGAPAGALRVDVKASSRLEDKIGVPMKDLHSYKPVSTCTAMRVSLAFDW